MQKVTGLAIFDVDGTIVEKNVMPPSVAQGIRHLQDRGYLTTISTGRRYVQIRAMLHDVFTTAVSPTALVIVEQGAKVVTRDGDVVKADYFEPGELDHLVDFARANAAMIHSLLFATPDPRKGVQVWCKNPDDIPAMVERRGSYADVFHTSFDELRERLTVHPVCNVSAKLESFVQVENLKLHFTRSDMDIVFQDSYMEFIKNISDKAKAVAYIEDYHNVHRKDVIVAGNAINDLDMLNLDAGTRILVGSTPLTATVFAQLRDKEKVVRVNSPEGLGEYLQKFKN